MHTLSMIVPKDVKMLSYNLLEQNFMQMQDLKKGGSSGGAPVKSFNLFYVDLPQVDLKFNKYLCIFNRGKLFIFRWPELL